MNDETDEIEDLIEQFTQKPDRYDVSDIDPAIVRVMKYIQSSTGLLGDYNEGIVQLAEGGRIIQWYARGNYFSCHDNLLNWVQMEADGVLIAQMGVRPHPDTEESTPYAEIHLAENWGYDDE